MNTTIITVGSVTYAIKVKRLLQQRRIQSKLVKIDAQKSLGGCTHGIEFPTVFFYAVVMELKKEDINYSVYSYQEERNDISR